MAQHSALVAGIKLNSHITVNGALDGGWKKHCGQF
jgi:hypothetical protein